MSERKMTAEELELVRIIRANSKNELGYHDLTDYGAVTYIRRHTAPLTAEVEEAKTVLFRIVDEYSDSHKDSPFFHQARALLAGWKPAALDEKGMEKFIELVRQGKIEGLRAEGDGYVAVIAGFRNGYTSVCCTSPIDEDQNDLDHLCAHIRRWLSGKGYGPELRTGGLSIHLGNGRHFVFDLGSELDWHLAAACWVCSREPNQTGEEG